MKKKVKKELKNTKDKCLFAVTPGVTQLSCRSREEAVKRNSGRGGN